MRYFEILKDWLNPSSLYEMTNLRSNRTGLPFIVFVSTKGGAKHDVRVKIGYGLNVKSSQLITVAIRPDIRVIKGTMTKNDFDLLTLWIEANKNALIEIWNSDDMDSLDIVAALKPI